MHNAYMSLGTSALIEAANTDTNARAELVRRREKRAAKFAASGSKRDGKLLESLDTAIAAINAPAPVATAPVAPPTPVAQPSAAAFTFVDVITAMSPEQLAALTPETIAAIAEMANV